jgi:predicted DCC family thiol-disulfide oxidoreductase YuxK
MKNAIETKNIVIFDGECGICQKLKQYAEKKDVHRHLKFIPYQDNNLSMWAPEVTRQMASENLFLIKSDEETYIGSKAIFTIMKMLPGIPKLLGYLFSLPFLLLPSQWIYKKVAKNRGRISEKLRMNKCLINED